MNLISFANFTQTDNQNSFLPSNEKDGGSGEDFSSLLNTISVTLQTANVPATNISGGFEQNNLQVQTISESVQNVVFGNNPVLAESPLVQVSNSELKTNLNQAFFSNSLDEKEINSSVNLTTETVIQNLRMDSANSFASTENLISIPTNFQPLPNLPTMQNLWSENSANINLPPIPKPQIPLPDNKNSDNFSNQNPTVSQNPISFNTTIPENAKEFEIVKETDYFFSNRKLSLVSELKPEPGITEENIFPQTANLKNISLLTNEITVNEEPIKIEVEYTKVPEIQLNAKNAQIAETNFNSLNTRIPSSLNQQLNILDLDSKAANLNFAPKLNSVLEYPVSQKINLPQELNLPVQIKQESDFSVKETVSHSLNQEVEISIPQNVEATQNPIIPQTFEIKTETISENPTVQANFPNPQTNFENNFENNIEPTFENSSAETNIPLSQTSFDNEVKIISENPTVQRNIPVSQTNVEIKPELKAEPVLPEVSSSEQPQQNDVPKVEFFAENKISEAEKSVIKTETNSVEIKEIKTEQKSVLEFENEVIVEAQKPKVESYKLNSEVKTEETPVLETTNLPVSNELQFSESAVSNEIPPAELASKEIRSAQLPVSNIIQPEVKNYEIKPLNVVSQSIKEIPVNQTIQNILAEQTATVETTNNNFVKFSLPTEENVSSKPKTQMFALETENTEPISLNTETVEKAKTPQIIPDKVLTTDFAPKVETSENKTAASKSSNSEISFDLNTKTEVQNHELPTNQKQNQTQEKSALNESVQMETGIKISETSSSNSSPYFNLSEKTEQEKKFNDPQNDLAVNFDKIFDNIIKKKEAVETAPQNQTEPTEIAEQVTPQLLQMAGLVEKKNGKEILKLRLNPAELGTVEITLEKNSSGVLNAHFKTETEGARQALSNGLEQLRDNLQNNGWNIGQMEISNGSSSSTNHQPQQNNQQKSEWIENFSFDRSSEKPDDSENNSPARLLNLQA